MRRLLFPGDSLMVGDSRYRVKRIGRNEWLTDHAELTDDPEKATDFASAIEAVMFAERHVDEPQLWTWEEIWTAGGNVETRPPLHESGRPGEVVRG